MEQGSGINISQRLSNEQQLLHDEKYIIHSLRSILEERHALQREGIEILALLQEVLSQGKSNAALGQEGLQAAAKLAIEQLTTVKPTTATADVQEPISRSLSLADEFDLASLDDIIDDNLKLNLTVPAHCFYDQFPEHEEFEDIMADEECEIDMNMLISGCLE